MLLYKYLGPERIDVVSGKAIRFTQPSHFNDPFEFRPAIDQLFSKQFLDDHIIRQLVSSPEVFRDHVISHLRDFYLRSPSELVISVFKKLTFLHMHCTNRDGFRSKEMTAQESVAHKFVGECISTCTDQDIIHIQAKMIRELLEVNPIILPAIQLWLSQHMIAALSSEHKWLFAEGFSKAADLHIGVLSLSEIWDNLLMWAHYADSHRGFVLAFDSNHSFFDQRKTADDLIRYLRQVKYTQERPKLTLTDLLNPELSHDERVDLFLDSFIFSKGAVWSYEKEWRMLMALEDADYQLENGDIYLFRYPPEMLKSIVMGHRAGSDLIRRMKSILNDDDLRHVKLLQASTEESDYRLIQKEI